MVTILFLFFMFWIFGCEACGILIPQTEIEPTPPALKGEVLTIGQSGKSTLLFETLFFIVFLALFLSGSLMVSQAGLMYLHSLNIYWKTSLCTWPFLHKGSLSFPFCDTDSLVRTVNVLGDSVLTHTWNSTSNCISLIPANISTWTSGAQHPPEDEGPCSAHQGSGLLLPEVRCSLSPCTASHPVPLKHGKDIDKM